MIASLEGAILKIKQNSLVIGVGGVGLHVFVPRNVLEELPGPGRTIFLHTHLIVRVDDTQGVTTQYIDVCLLTHVVDLRGHFHGYVFRNHK